MLGLRSYERGLIFVLRSNLTGRSAYDLALSIAQGITDGILSYDSAKSSP